LLWERLIDAIAANDPERAVEEMKCHLDRSHSLFSVKSPGT
jgi:DNA-binding GntR family transcriptional regulator